MTIFVVAMALHNIPEGIASGVGFGLGAFLGYFFISGFASLLPFALSFAGGTMVYVIYSDGSSESGESGGESMIFLLGAAFMLLFSAII